MLNLFSLYEALYEVGTEWFMWGISVKNNQIAGNMGCIDKTSSSFYIFQVPNSNIEYVTKYLFCGHSYSLTIYHYLKEIFHWKCLMF